MSQHDDFDRSLARWFEAEARPAGTADVLDRALRATSLRRPRPRLVAALGSHWAGDSIGPTPVSASLGRPGVRTSMALLLLLLVLGLVAGAILVGARLFQPAPVDLGIFAPVAGHIVYGDDQGIWGVDPAAPEARPTRVKLTSEAGTPLAWSSDGTKLLVMRGSSPEIHLFVLHADGSEVQVTERPLSIRGATISPDGSRVVFTDSDALYSIDADGGPAKMLLESRYGMLREPTFAPNGRQIAYVDGRGDWGHSVWLVDPDGSDAHQIMSNEWTDGPGHVSGLAWSPAGDRIALALEGSTYTFATDGSGFTRLPSLDGDRPYWSPDGSQLAFNRGGLVIADADGSNVLRFGYGASGPWHPGTPET